jgi:hypothetical protein
LREPIGVPVVAHHFSDRDLEMLEDLASAGLLRAASAVHAGRATGVAVARTGPAKS